MDISRPLSRRGGRTFAFWFAVLVVVTLDQAVKAAVRARLAVGEVAPLLPGVLRLEHVENTGAAFSMGEGAGVLFVLVALAVLVACVLLVWREELPLPLAAAVGCVAGGGVGNAVDRVLFGSVTDFFATTFVSFPVFNVADVFVTCGIALALVGYCLWDARRTREEALAHEACDGRS
ncbi:lipoprotein signal peptidase [Olsenella uli DSM 7084]|uniref:Lipoprotein signal peptidase n=1 Tax=Olsenella uli (strain ATCC 49627 / DSM 7084 / CCUG 31166 / CIP 109912 / JCM 12494 / LMG 11480 / NCIMB 702895 / VPI D76D-27C) TaxID=633147 RepID=E1QVJ7_OLSUV|nr:signal peptidase II [Olsenella uli]ADK68150.1 lipoprotein signal peptidase [Olsenella uli DSM 7084]EUB32522.1 signal peptidase II [Olsenella uli MSTE5]KRO13051.1 lipoprotein signal peptidase [Olsenella uli DSM 7084]MBS6418387.1 signal peptidase II [Olsenella uli]